MEDKKKKKKVKSDSAAEKTPKKKTKRVKEEKESPSPGKKRKREEKSAESEQNLKKKPKGILKMRSSEGEVLEPDEEPPLVNPSFQPSATSSSNSKKDKMRKKKEMKRAAKATAQEAKKNDAGEEIRRVEAREYLRCWKEDKTNWKFNKTRQTWLLKNLFLPEALNDETFGIALEYLRPLKGNAREETIKQAEAKVNESGVEFLQAERARLVAQMLA